MSKTVNLFLDYVFNLKEAVELGIDKNEYGAIFLKMLLSSMAENRSVQNVGTLSIL